MTDTATVAKELEGWMLDAVHKTNTVAYEALKVLTDAVKPVTAAIPSVTPPAGLRLCRAVHVGRAEVRPGRAAPDRAAHAG